MATILQAFDFLSLTVGQNGLEGLSDSAKRPALKAKLKKVKLMA